MTTKEDDFVYNMGQHLALQLASKTTELKLQACELESIKEELRQIKAEKIQVERDSSRLKQCYENLEQDYLHMMTQVAHNKGSQSDRVPPCGNWIFRSSPGFTA